VAQTALINRREKVEKVAEFIEKNLHIQGATGTASFLDQPQEEKGKERKRKREGRRRNRGSSNIIYVLSFC